MQRPTQTRRYPPWFFALLQHLRQRMAGKLAPSAAWFNNCIALQSRRHRMKFLLAGALGLLMSSAMPVMAHSAKQQNVQASMLVSGTIMVATDGSVAGYTLDKSEKLPQPVVGLLAKAIPQWRFAAVTQDGKPVMVKSAMHVRVVAKPVDEDNFSISVGSSWFGDGHSDACPSTDYKPHPAYPPEAIKQRVSGTVYLVMSIDRDGHVRKMAAEQVNLRVLGREKEMQRWRDMLADAALRAAGHWSFHPPTTGPGAARDHWEVRVPINFELRQWGRPSPFTYGQWVAYVPGPKQPIPWVGQKGHLADASDALPPGGVYMAEQGLHRIDTPRS
jgi:hypothetical protein